MRSVTVSIFLDSRFIFTKISVKIIKMSRLLMPVPGLGSDSTLIFW